MRATKNKHYGSDSYKRPYSAAKADKTVRKHKPIKITSAVCASLVACAALVIPTTTLAPNVDAYEDTRVASFSIGGLDQFSAVISNNCTKAAAISFTEPVTEAEKDTKETEKAADAKDEEKKSETSDSQSSKSKEEKSEKSSSSDSSSKPSRTESSSAGGNEDTYADDDTDDDAVYPEDDSSSSSDDSENYLIYISNPDYNYRPSKISLSSYDRAKLERLVMGEAGSMRDISGIALVAQSIRDAMNRSGTTSIDRIISEYQYFGSTAVEPNAKVKEAVSFIFDQNGSAVQHRVLCFYVGSSAWHETQTFIAQVENVRFFDLKC